MARKSYTTEHIINWLREADIHRRTTNYLGVVRYYKLTNKLLENISTQMQTEQQFQPLDKNFFQLYTIQK